MPGLVAGAVLQCGKDGATAFSARLQSAVGLAASPPARAPALPLARWQGHCGVRYTPGHKRLCEVKK